MIFLMHYSVAIAVLLRMISCLLLLFFCIPLQIKEAGVKNGLRLLRIQLLSFGVILFLTNLFSLTLLWLGWGTPQRPINALLQVVNAIAFLLLAVIGHLMYHQQYSEESKSFHEK